MKSGRMMVRKLAAGMDSMAAQSAHEVPTASFALSLVAGLLILAGTGIMMAISSGGSFYGMMGGYYGMMDVHFGMMQRLGYGGWFNGVAGLGLISGIAILGGATMIYVQPSKASTWGLLVLVFSTVSFFGMGGFFLGAILGFVGGILAIAWKPGATPR